MNKFKKIWLIALLIIMSMVLIAWTTNTGSILYTGEVVFQGPIVSTGPVTLPAITTGAITAADVTAEGLTADSLALTSASYAFATTTANDTYSVAGVGTVFLDSSSFAGTIGGLTGGVANQHLFISVIDATETITIENAEGGTGQDINLDGAADVTLNVNEGIHLVCDGSDWWEIRR